MGFHLPQRQRTIFWARTDVGALKPCLVFLKMYTIRLYICDKLLSVRSSDFEGGQNRGFLTSKGVEFRIFEVFDSVNDLTRGSRRPIRPIF